MRRVRAVLAAAVLAAAGCSGQPTEVGKHTPPKEPPPPPRGMEKPPGTPK